jgi:hypothetical protein
MASNLDELRLHQKDSSDYKGLDSAAFAFTSTQLLHKKENFFIEKEKEMRSSL